MLKLYKYNVKYITMGQELGIPLDELGELKEKIKQSNN
jgi:hypothetical protein